jgi:hypothetical protein
LTVLGLALRALSRLTVLGLALHALSKENLFVAMRRRFASHGQLVVNFPARTVSERDLRGLRLYLSEEDPVAFFRE